MIKSKWGLQSFTMLFWLEEDSSGPSHSWPKNHHHWQSFDDGSTLLSRISQWCYVASRYLQFPAETSPMCRLFWGSKVWLQRGLLYLIRIWLFEQGLYGIPWKKYCKVTNQNQKNVKRAQYQKHFLSLPFKWRAQSIEEFRGFNLVPKGRYKAG